MVIMVQKAEGGAKLVVVPVLSLAHWPGPGSLVQRLLLVISKSVASRYWSGVILVKSRANAVLAEKLDAGELRALALSEE